MARRLLMIPPVRQFALTAHVTASVGWLGSVAAFLLPAIVGLRSAAADGGCTAPLVATRLSIYNRRV